MLGVFDQFLFASPSPELANTINIHNWVDPSFGVATIHPLPSSVPIAHDLLLLLQSHVSSSSGNSLPSSGLTLTWSSSGNPSSRSTPYRHFPRQGNSQSWIPSNCPPSGFQFIIQSYAPPAHR